MTIGRFTPEDAEEVSALIIRALREVNIRDYPEEYIEDIVRKSRPEDVVERAGWTHFYVARDAGGIAGCGAIGPYWGREDESCLFTIFVHPERQGEGIGRAIIEALEKDEYFLRAKRTEVPASITAAPFYLKMGYVFKDGVAEPDGESLIRMEKRR